MNFKLNSALLILLICFACLTISHGHSHDGLNGHHHSHDHHDHHHHGHSHEDTKPSFKYTREANEEIKRQANEHSHQHNEPHHHEEQKAPKRAVPLSKPIHFSIALLSAYQVVEIMFYTIFRYLRFMAAFTWFNTSD